MTERQVTSEVVLKKAELNTNCNEEATGNKAQTAPTHTEKLYKTSETPFFYYMQSVSPFQGLFLSFQVLNE